MEEDTEPVVNMDEDDQPSGAAKPVMPEVKLLQSL